MRVAEVNPAATATAAASLLLPPQASGPPNRPTPTKSTPDLIMLTVLAAVPTLFALLLSLSLAGRANAARRAAADTERRRIQSHQ